MFMLPQQSFLSSIRGVYSGIASVMALITAALLSNSYGVRANTDLVTLAKGQHVEGYSLFGEPQIVQAIHGNPGNFIALNPATTEFLAFGLIAGIGILIGIALAQRSIPMMLGVGIVPLLVLGLFGEGMPTMLNEYTPFVCVGAIVAGIFLIMLLNNKKPMLIDRRSADPVGEAQRVTAPVIESTRPD